MAESTPVDMNELVDVVNPLNGDRTRVGRSYLVRWPDDYVLASVYDADAKPPKPPKPAGRASRSASKPADPSNTDPAHPEPAPGTVDPATVDTPDKEHKE